MLDHDVPAGLEPDLLFQGPRNIPFDIVEIIDRFRPVVKFHLDLEFGHDLPEEALDGLVADV